MSFKPIIVLLAICLLAQGCRESASSNETELKLELLAKELELKERELALKEKELELLEGRIAEDRSMTTIYKEAKRAVFLVSTQKEYGTSKGSAFVISPSGLAVSNYHVFQNASQVIVANEYGDEFMVTEIVDYDAEQDYVLFKIGPNDGKMPFLDIAKELPEVGEPCFTIGNPKGLTQTLSDGIISAHRDNQRMIQHTTEITSGSSGGPLFNETGEVVGITSSGYRASNLNFAINIQSLPINEHLSSTGQKERSMSSYEILKLLVNYYQFLENENLDQLSETYNETLSRYHSLFNINKYQAIDDHVNFFKKYDIVKADIRDQSIQLSFNGSAYFLTYQLDWGLIKQADGSNLNYTLETIVEIDPNGCINSIYDNILKKKIS